MIQFTCLALPLGSERYKGTKRRREETKEGREREYEREKKKRINTPKQVYR